MSKNKAWISNKTKKHIFERDGYRCRYCGEKDRRLTIDHVYPESKGGVHAVENFVTACTVCNGKKWNFIGIWPKPIGYFDEKDIQDNKWIDIHFVLKYLSLSFLFISCLFLFLIPFGNLFMLVYVGLVALSFLFWITQYFFVDKNIKHRITHR